MPQSEPTRPVDAGVLDSSHKRLCRIGGIAALLWVAIAPAEIIIGLLPGVEDTLSRTATVEDWFRLFQDRWFLGLRSFGVLNMAGAALMMPTILAVYFVLRRKNEAYAALGAIIFFVGTAVYFADNRAFPMLALSREYAKAATDVQRSLLAAAGQTMLAEGESRSGILIIEFSFLVISAVMLRSGIFGKAAALAGMLGSVLMMILEIAFMPPHGAGMVIAASGGLAMMAWSFLIGWQLLQIH